MKDVLKVNEYNKFQERRIKMRYAWILRPYPHGFYRVKEFLIKNIVAIGWPGIGDLSQCKSRDDIKEILQTYYKYSSPQSLGQSAGNIYRFIFELKAGDYVIVPDGSVVYIGMVKSPYKYDASVASDKEGYPHQRDVTWLYEKKAIARNLLTGRVYDSLKGQQTIYSTYHDDIEDIVVNKRHYFTKQFNYDLKAEYLKKLQNGLLRNINSNTFEEAVCSLYARFLPGLRRLATTNSEKGDTDLLAELLGKVIVRIQVKHFYPEEGELEDWVVDQLADSMETGEHGIIITSGTISKAAREKAEAIADKTITFIDGQEFVEHLFAGLDSMPKEALATFGLTYEIGFF